MSYPKLADSWLNWALTMVYKKLGLWFWVYGFGSIVWTYDFGGTALHTRAGQAQKYIPILNRKIND